METEDGGFSFKQHSNDDTDEQLHGIAGYQSLHVRLEKTLCR